MRIRAITKCLSLTPILLAVAWSCVTTLPLTVDNIAGSFRYRAFDVDGEEVARGTMVFQPGTTQASGAIEFAGSWTIDRSGDPAILIGPQTGSGDFLALLENGELFLSLNPERADDNVFLAGTLQDAEISGSFILDR